jgi:predicted AAA+ superfamily ATPase
MGPHPRSSIFSLFSTLENTHEYGKAFEHFFLCELIRLNDYKRLDLEFSFYRTERGAEVDCIGETPQGKIIAVEIKSTAVPSTAHCTGLYSFKQKVHDVELILACQAPHCLKLREALGMSCREALQYIAGR